MITKRYFLFVDVTGATELECDENLERVVKESRATELIDFEVVIEDTSQSGDGEE